MDFGKILKKAWQIIWKHKILWLFGFFASCGSAMNRGGGNNARATMSSQGPSSNGAQDLFPFLDPPMRHSLETFFRNIEAVEPWVWVMIALAGVFLAILLSVLFLFLGTLGTTGVIKGTALADEAGPDGKPLSFGTIFTAIKPYFWKVLLLNLGLRIVGFFVVLILILPIILFTVCTCFLGLFLLIPLGWFIELMINFTTIAIVEEDLDIFKAISRAWGVITRNLGYVAVMFLILGIGQFILGLIIGLPLILVPIPLLVNLLATGFSMVSIGLVISILLFIVVLPIVVFLGGVLKAYILASWTLTYRYLIGDENLEPLVLNSEEKDQETDEAQEG
jgi:hypothetical protein